MDLKAKSEGSMLPQYKCLNSYISYNLVYTSKSLFLQIFGCLMSNTEFLKSREQYNR